MHKKKRNNTNTNMKEISPFYTLFRNHAVCQKENYTIYVPEYDYYDFLVIPIFFFFQPTGCLGKCLILSD